MQLQQAYETFIADKRITGCSKETIRFYNYSVGRLLFFVQKDRVVETDDLGPQINPYFLHLHESGLSPPIRFRRCFVGLGLSLDSYSRKVSLRVQYGYPE